MQRIKGRGFVRGKLLETATGQGGRVAFQDDKTQPISVFPN